MEDDDVVNGGLHPHPLLFEREGKCGGACSRCGLLLLHKASFRCSDSDCNFQIHQSCIHLPHEIQSVFHLQHPLFLQSNSISNCKVCGEEQWFQTGYLCTKCLFYLDPKCAITNKNLRETSDGKYLHTIHPQHPLTLALSPPLEQRGQNGGKTIKKLVYYCVVCELPIQSGSSTYFCSLCDDDDYDNVHFHKTCAELPMQKEIQDHPHPLSLLKGGNQSNTPCHVCRNKCKGFIYSCLECRFFNVHIPCLKSFNHEHDFTKLRFIIEFQCGVCGEKSKDRSVFLCNICHNLVHEECVEFSSTLRIYEHHHDLTYFKYYYLLDDVRHCEICGKKINNLYAGYGCSECNYFSHFQCAQRRCVESAAEEVAAEKQADQQHLNIIHPHKLTEFGPEEISTVMKYRVCDGCMKCLSISSPSYGCSQCDFYLHEECAKLPATIKTRVIHRHNLTLISTPNSIFECGACRRPFHGFAYRCETCLFTVDVRCASIQTSFLHPNHPHTLFLYQPKISMDYDACDACGNGIVGQIPAFQCVKPHCKFHLDLRCATLPVEVRYRFDQHPLYLTFFEEEEGEEKEYYCDICEEERMPWVPFYQCRKCSFKAHERCAVGEFPFVKSAMHKSHRHPLNWVGKLRIAPNGGTYFDHAFECGACKFEVHGSGPSYELQPSEGNQLVWTNYNVFSRANQPYEQSIQNSTVKELGPFPPSLNGNGKPWKEKFFSTITAFVIHSNETYGWVRCIQFQYSKNGELVWSSKHGEEDNTKHEVCFDYPDEYLVQIHGSYLYGSELESLSIESNRKMYGPFGRDDGGRKGEIFGSENGENIIGIFGTIDEDGALESIGFHYISTNQ